MTDAFVSVDNHCLAADHGQHVAFRTDAGAGSATDAICSVDVRMLRLRSLGEQLSFFGCLARTGFPFLQALQVNHQEKETDDPAYAVSDERIQSSRNTPVRIEVRYESSPARRRHS